MPDFAYNTQVVQPQPQLQGQQLSQNISVGLRKYSQADDFYRYSQNTSNFQTNVEPQRKDQQYVIQNQVNLIEHKDNYAQRTAQKPHLKDIFEHQNDQIRMIMNRHRAFQPNPYRPFYNNQFSQSNIIQQKESSSNPSTNQLFNQPNGSTSLPPNHRLRNQTVLDNIHEVNKSSLAKISFNDSSDFRKGNQSIQQHSSKQQRRGSSIFVSVPEDEKLINSHKTYEMSQYDQTYQKKSNKVSKNLSTITKFQNQIKQKQQNEQKKVSSTLLNYPQNSLDLLQTQDKIEEKNQTIDIVKPSVIQQISDDELKLSYQGSDLHSQSISRNARQYEQEKFTQTKDSKFQKRNRSMMDRSMLEQQKNTNFSPFKQNSKNQVQLFQEIEEKKLNNSKLQHDEFYYEKMKNLFFLQEESLIQNLKQSQNHLKKIIQNFTPKQKRQETGSSLSHQSPKETFDNPESSLPPIERRFSNNLKELQLQILNTSKFKKFTGFENDQINPNYFTTSQRDRGDQQFINSPKFSSCHQKDFNFNSFSPQSDNKIIEPIQKNEILNIEKQKNFLQKTEDLSTRLPQRQVQKKQKFIGPLINKDLKQFITPQSNEILDQDFSSKKEQQRFQNNQSTISINQNQKTPQLSISPMKVEERVVQFRKVYGMPTFQNSKSPSIINSDDKSREILSQNSDNQMMNSDWAEDSPNKFNRYNPSIMIIESQERCAEQGQATVGGQEQGDSFHSLEKKKVKDNKQKKSKMMPKSIERFQIKNCSNNYSPILAGLKRKQFEDENRPYYEQQEPQIKESHFRRVKQTDQFYEVRIHKTHTYQGEQSKTQFMKNIPQQNKQNFKVIIPKNQNSSTNLITPQIEVTQQSPTMADKSMVKNQLLYTPSPIKEYEDNREKELKFSLKDFDVQNKIGQGNFSVVFKAICKQTDLEVALKIVRKESVGLMKQVDHILNERAILKYLQIVNEEQDICPFIVKFIGSFYNEDNLYFQLEYLDGGNLLTYIRNRNKKIADNVQFYAAEVIMALEFLHKQGIVYRDLKPENIVLSIKNNGHIKIVDFGFAKFLREPTNLQNLPNNENALFMELKKTWANLQSKNERTSTSCGTPVYMAPEICQGIPYSYKVDIWSLGVLIVEIVSGKLPFTGDSPKEIQENILKCQPTFSSNVSQQLRDLCRKIFVPDSDNRIRISEIKKHQFFQKISTWNYRNFYRKEKAPYIPVIQPFDEQLQRNIENGELEAAQGLMGILQAPTKKREAVMSFDSDHFKKFLREHEKPKDNNDLSEEKPSAKKRKRHNILGDFKLKKIEMFF